METIKKILRNQYFPAAAVLVAVALFWIVALSGGLSMLNARNAPLATLTWMLFVYLVAALTPVVGLFAAVDLVRRYRWNRTMQREQNAAVPADRPAQQGPAASPAEPVLAQPVLAQPAAAQPAKQKADDTSHGQKAA